MMERERRERKTGVRQKFATRRRRRGRNPPFSKGCPEEKTEIWETGGKTKWGRRPFKNKTAWWLGD